MKILIIDRDSLSTQMLKAKLESMGHRVAEEPVKNAALERLEREEFDIVFLDPAPLTNARPVVLGVRRAMKRYPYVVLMSHDLARDEAVKSGANDVAGKPVDMTIIEDVINNAERMTGLVKRMGDDSEDFPSAGGVIAKSAFNQLFLSAIDRADRYAERSFMVFIDIRNRRDIIAMDGAYAAEYATAKLSQYLVRLRRQSDIIAQTGKSEYCLLLQRPLYENEPREAANRFAEALGKLEDICGGDGAPVEIRVALIDAPVGALHVEHIITHQKKSARGAG